MPEPTAEEVERGARAAWKHIDRDTGTDTPWETLSELAHANLRVLAAATLKAARSYDGVERVSSDVRRRNQETPPEAPPCD